MITKKNLKKNYITFYIMDFKKYLTDVKTKEKQHTHTRIGGKNIYGGKYNIEDLDKFWELYHHYVFNLGKKEYLTEKQIENGQILIDLDFRYSWEINQRQHSKDNIDRVVDIYVEAIKTMYKIDTPIKVYVFEKPTVNPVKDKKKTKDGVHIIIGLSSTKTEQLVIRDYVKNNIASVLDDLPLQNSYDEVLDIGISKGTCNWQVYGSRKPNNKRYHLKYIQTFNIDGDGDVVWDEDEVEFDIKKLLPIISARYKDMPKCKLTELGYKMINAYGEKMKSKRENTTKKIKKKYITPKFHGKIKYCYEFIKQNLYKISLEKINDVCTAAGIILQCAKTQDKKIYEICKGVMQQSDKFDDVWFDNTWNSYNKDKHGEYEFVYGMNRTHTKFSYNYFHKLKLEKFSKEVEEKENELKKLKEKINKIEDDTKLKASAIKNAIKKVKREMADIHEQLNAIHQARTDAEFKLKKKYFELFVFKIISPHAYGVVTEKELLLYKKGELINLFENLKLNGEAGEFIGTWFKSDNKTMDLIDFLPYGLDCPKDTYNLFNGFAIEKKNVEPAPLESIDIILKHIKNLGGGEEVCLEYQLNYFAHMIQHPAKKPLVAVLYKSDREGSGKNLFLEALYKNILGREYGMATADQEDIFRRFNTSYQKFMLIFDEAKGKDSFMNSEKIKSRITCDDVYMEQKGFKGKMIKDFARCFFLTNNRTGVKVGLEDRRFVIFKCIDTFANDPKYFKPLATALYDDSIMQTFYNYLKDRDISNFDPINDRPLTEEYKQMQSVNVPTIARFLSSYVDNEEFYKQFNDGLYTDVVVKAGEFYEECSGWALEKGFKATNQTAFGIDIKQFEGVSKKRKGSGVVYIIKLNKLKNYLIKKGYYETLEQYKYNAKIHHEIEKEITKGEKATCEIEFCEKNLVL